MGPEGKYEHQGLAKQIILGMVAAPGLKLLLATLGIRQNGDQVFLTGKVPSQDALDKVLELVKDIKGTKTVESSEVIVSPE